MLIHTQHIRVSASVDMTGPDTSIHASHDWVRFPSSTQNTQASGAAVGTMERAARTMDVPMSSLHHFAPVAV